MDVRGELVFSGFVSRQPEERHELLPLASMSEQAIVERENPISRSMSNQISKPLSLGPMSD